MPQGGQHHLRERLRVDVPSQPATTLKTPSIGSAFSVPRHVTGNPITKLLVGSYVGELLDHHLVVVEIIGEFLAVFLAKANGSNFDKTWSNVAHCSSLLHQFHFDGEVGFVVANHHQADFSRGIFDTTLPDILVHFGVDVQFFVFLDFQVLNDLLTDDLHGSWRPLKPGDVPCVAKRDNEFGLVSACHSIHLIVATCCVAIGVVLGATPCFGRS